MGGDEARVAVVGYTPDNPDNNPALIQSEVEKEWEDAKAKVRIFGEQHLRDLPAYLQDWFNRASS